MNRYGLPIILSLMAGGVIGIVASGWIEYTGLGITFPWNLALSILAGIATGSFIYMLLIHETKKF